MINGSKQFITNSGTDITKFVTVTAVTGERENGKKEISTIIVPTNTPGFTAEPAYDKVGWNASDTHPLSFSDVRVPKAKAAAHVGGIVDLSVGTPVDPTPQVVRDALAAVRARIADAASQLADLLQARAARIAAPEAPVAAFASAG